MFGPFRLDRRTCVNRKCCEYVNPTNACKIIWFSKFKNFLSVLLSRFSSLCERKDEQKNGWNKWDSLKWRNDAINRGNVYTVHRTLNTRHSCNKNRTRYMSFLLDSSYLNCCFKFCHAQVYLCGPIRLDRCTCACEMWLFSHNQIRNSSSHFISAVVIKRRRRKK